MRTAAFDYWFSYQSGEFDWTPEEQGFVLGSFYYGFIVTQIPGGILTEKYGGKWMMGLMTFFAGFLFHQHLTKQPFGTKIIQAAFLEKTF